MKCYFCAILNQMCKNRMEQEHQFIDYIEQSIIKNWDKDALTDYKGITLQYKDVARKIAKFHIVLESAGIQPGDKIAVCGRNSAHWGVTFLATITYGAVIVPILHEFKADNIHNIVNHSEAKLLFVGDQAWENLNEDAMPLLEGIASLTDFTALVSRNEKLTYAFEHRNAIYGQRYPKNFRPEHICYRKDRPEELAIINYTSGTTGYSKGVMLPYRSIWSNVAYCFEMLPVKAGDHIVSMLPMGHVFGMVYDFLYGFSAGAHIYFLTRMPSPKIIAQSFAEIKPRVISCVPLIVEKIIKKDILPRVDSKIGKLLLKVPIVNDKIKSLARQAAMEIFGGNFDEIIIGGAPFNAEVEAFLKKIGFPYTLAYGMTECGPIICSSRWETLKLASCGKATTRMEVRIDSPDPKTHAGEIVCRGMNMMLGYYKNPEATAQIIDARPAARFNAEVDEPRPGLRRGHIPGALNVPWTELVREGELKTTDELDAIFFGRGVSYDKPIIVSCGSGVTAAVVLLALATLDVPNVKLYDGAWSEWGARADLPVEPVK